MVTPKNALSMHAFCTAQHTCTAPGAIDESAASRRAGTWQSREPM